MGSLDVKHPYEAKTFSFALVLTEHKTIPYIIVLKKCDETLKI